jgi:sugar phosphate isomerase/epimerase
MSDEHLALGDGTIPWDVVGGAVRKDYRGVIVIEGRSIQEAQRSLSVFSRYFL